MECLYLRTDSDQFVRTPNSGPEAEAHVQGALLQLAYKNNIANIGVNLVAGIGIAIELFTSGMEQTWVICWLSALLFLSAIRLTLNFFVSARKLEFCRETDQVRAQWRRYYALGLICGALLWGGLVLLIRDTASVEIQFSLLIIISALAAGAAGILAAQLLIGRMYIVLMLVQGSVSLMLARHPQYVLGSLGLVFLVVMLVAHRNNHTLLRRSLELQFANQQLVDDLEDKQETLEQLNATLEERVKMRTAQLRYLAEHDNLTRLFNRMGILRWVEENEMQRTPAQRYSVLFIDLDRFKQINDGLGHTIGDYVLTEVAAMLTRTFPKNSGLCRWGGDEFLALIPEAEGEEPGIGEQALQDLRKTMEAPLLVSGHKLHVGFSAGVALSRRDSTAVSEAIRAADLASGEAKRHGRGTTRHFSSALSTEQERRLLVAQMLKKAIEEKELSLVFQPIVSSDLERTTAWETLIRWDNRILGRVSPNEFIPVAEDTGDIIPIGHWVLRQALAQFAAAGLTSGSSRLAVNLSLRQLMIPDLPEQIDQLLREHGIAAHHLILEVTESIFERRNRTTISVALANLNQMGVELRIDDFGAGYSSLSRLHEMPIRALKIDKSFIRSLDQRARAIIEGCILIARRFRIEVIAEGIETVEQYRALQELGVDSMQGYLFGRPEESFENSVNLRDLADQILTLNQPG